MFVYVYMYMHMYGMYVWYVCTFVCLLVCVCVCVYTHTPTHTHTHTYTHLILDPVTAALLPKTRHVLHVPKEAACACTRGVHAASPTVTIRISRASVVAEGP